MVLTRRNLLLLLAANVVVFVLSNVVSTNGKGSGTASEILWVVFLIGMLALIVLSIVALVQSARSRRASVLRL